MNNKGFAITTILYGTLILFLLLITSMLGILSTYIQRMNLLVEKNNGSRDIITMKSSDVSSGTKIVKRGLYCVNRTGDTCCKTEYYSVYDIANCN